MASIILPLRHPAHVAKAAASADHLSGGRLILGLASGDRPDEFPALNVPFESRGERFRSSFEYIRRMAEFAPAVQSEMGHTNRSMDLLPKPFGKRLPLLITGGSQQSSEWIAENGDGWMMYPRDAATQAQLVRNWRSRIAEASRPDQPVMQPFHIDLVENAPVTPQTIHLGYRLGIDQLADYLRTRREIGINHVALNLRFNQANIEDTLKRLADKILPEFNTPAS